MSRCALIGLRGHHFPNSWSVAVISPMLGLLRQ
jgi:hypothetical protein